MGSQQTDPQHQPAVPFWLRLTPVRPEEVQALIWCMIYIFCVLSAYYVLRPIRDTFGIDGGLHNLQWLFSATLIAILALNLPFAALSRALPRKRFIPLVYRFFISQLIIFAVLKFALPSSMQVWLGRVFFVWLSVFNLYVVSVFWSLVADIFSRERASRLFAMMAAGATLGAILGSAITALLVHRLNTVGLFVLAALLLECAVACVKRLSTFTHLAEGDAAAQQTQPLGGGVFSGIARIFQSPYLLNICLYMLLYSVTSTLIYFRQAELVHHLFQHDSDRTAFFATLDLVVNVLTLVTQLFVTSRLMSRYGTKLVLGLLPLITLLGFASMSLWPVAASIVVFSVLRRGANFAFARPAREVLFTVLQREDKYKAKNVIDTAVYRAGDQVGAWSWAAMGAAGLSGGMLIWLALPLSLIWLVNSQWLGRRQVQLEAKTFPPLNEKLHENSHS
ncbi:NTP/NDP exchange transporter [Pantoea cypripedii]|uniref:MFS transporter n=1 Tax=Pantoea cypripedii TaxID=55209 RepID=A0A1X1EY01_PANCY|nr:MFS transporter [Pantoea cypripedii]MBP2195021.1 AAA family ATP:ADP antiporter [Pantoea cypripedii]ORM94862.1 MFS transporter [Pantoea cypripedii]